MVWIQGWSVVLLGLNVLHILLQIANLLYLSPSNAMHFSVLVAVRLGAFQVARPRSPLHCSEQCALIVLFTAFDTERSF
jgi:hypothetical protein